MSKKLNSIEPLNTAALWVTSKGMNGKWCYRAQLWQDCVFQGLVFFKVKILGGALFSKHLVGSVSFKSIQLITCSVSDRGVME